MSRWAAQGSRGAGKGFPEHAGGAGKAEGTAAWGSVGVLTGEFLLFEAPGLHKRRGRSLLGQNSPGWLLPHVLAEKEIIWLESGDPATQSPGSRATPEGAVGALTLARREAPGKSPCFSEPQQEDGEQGPRRTQAPGGCRALRAGTPGFLQETNSKMLKCVFLKPKL